MKLDDIQTEWDKDSQINRSDLINEALKIPLLHAKYYNIYMAERKLLKEHQEKFKQEEYKVWMYYQGKLDKEDLGKLGREQLDIKFLKGDVQKVVDADEHIINYKLKIGMQEDKVEYLKSIISLLNNRSFLIGHAIDMIKFEAGLA